MLNILEIRSRSFKPEWVCALIEEQYSMVTAMHEDCVPHIRNTRAKGKQFRFDSFHLCEFALRVDVSDRTGRLGDGGIICVCSLGFPLILALLCAETKMLSLSRTLFLWYLYKHPSSPITRRVVLACGFLLLVLEREREACLLQTKPTS